MILENGEKINLSALQMSIEEYKEFSERWDKACNRIKEIANRGAKNETGQFERRCSSGKRFN